MQRERDAHLMFLVIWVILQSDVLLGGARHVRRDGVPHRSEERRSAHVPTNPFILVHVRQGKTVMRHFP